MVMQHRPCSQHAFKAWACSVRMVACCTGTKAQPCLGVCFHERLTLTTTSSAMRPEALLARYPWIAAFKRYLVQHNP
jgi:hypothetical protein